MWRSEKTKAGSDLIWDGVELGIAQSPTKGTAIIQNANIATEQGEVMASYARVSQQPALVSGTLTPDGATDFTGPANLRVGQWIKATASTVSSIPVFNAPTTLAVDYLIVAGGGAGGGCNIGAGGGGAGGEVIADATAIAVGNYLVKIGNGGQYLSSTILTESDGKPSSIATIDTADGGGGGGSSFLASVNGRPGGNGGGGGFTDLSVQGLGGIGTPGFNGGLGTGGTTGRAKGGGGGGASEAGAAPVTDRAGKGGNGLTSAISGTSTPYGGLSCSNF